MPRHCLGLFFGLTLSSVPSHQGQQEYFGILEGKSGDGSETGTALLTHLASSPPFAVQLCQPLLARCKTKGW